MSDVPCDCCLGPQVLTPLDRSNRAGLGALRYRVGTYATFFDSMRAQLSSAAFFQEAGRQMGHEGRLDLAGLKTREPSDFSIALLDAWAVGADVLSFYQERIANEGYLRCATERRSVLELARLVGYALRPGVAASVYLAYALEKDAVPVEIPKGARVNSVPAPGEQMQAFETAEPLSARVEWNELGPRMQRPLRLLASNASYLEQMRFKGAAIGLARNDVLLLTFGRQPGQQVMRKVAAVAPDSAANETLVSLQLPTKLKPILTAWSDISAAYADVEWRCLPKNDPLQIAVVDSLFDLHLALETLLPELDDYIESSDELEGQQADDYKSVLVKYMAFKLAGTALLKLGDKEVRAWLSAYFLEAFRYLGIGLLNENALLDLFEKEFGLSAGANMAVLSQAAVGPLIPALLRPRSLQPANSKRLARQVGATYAPRSDIKTRLLASLRPALSRSLYQAWRHAPAGKPEPVEVFAMRIQAPLFGHNAQKRTRVSQSGEVTVIGDWPVVEEVLGGTTVPTSTLIYHEERSAVYLDAAYEKILPNSWLIVSTPYVSMLTTQQTQFFWAGKPDTTRTRAEYGMTGKTTRVPLLQASNMSDGVWIEQPNRKSPDKGDDFSAIRATVVYAHSDKLELAEMPIGDDVCGDHVELAGLYEGLEAGRWVIVSGERSDVKDDRGRAVAGVMASELLMLSGVTQDVVRVAAAAPPNPNPGLAAAGAGPGGLLTEIVAAAGAAAPPVALVQGDNLIALPGESVHTYLEFANALAYKFKRATVKIRANVVKATHGETRQEILGSGDAAKALQSFTLKQAPLTYVSAPTAAGVASSLTLRVNDIEWHEADTLAGLGPRERKFVTRTGDDGKTAVVFGNGRAGARLPGGQENVRAVYRNGIGKPGNVKAEQISLLATRPLGAKSVINPLRASGGADPESRDQARANAPLAVMALDRLVSVQDHADFARTFGGVGKASATARSDGRREVVHLSIAGADDIPIDASSDLLRNLRAALHRLGDPSLPIRLQVRERLALVVAARVRLEPDYLWEAVEAQLRRAMLAAFGFDALELGRDLFASAAIAVLQGVRGVAWVDLDVFDAISEAALLEGFKSVQAAQLELRQRIAISLGGVEDGALQPAQIAYLAPDVADTLILQEIAA
ncbi:putative baseplate assembly protein [Janthinobacterium fluminis]|uniref:Baseplate assembly protein n=1 Tax=Janthinobacterium fluminis TaxID=2987524 RepID=A0ABT5JZT5_9BURK|nr:putative baseplate assembly protein [Janthinobacterium fluminis]MDC8757002.1 putative baseplate assembly protein [Janthinobacterium fluminis]